MKLLLYWFLTAITMASASQIHDREGALGQVIRPRGDKYNECITVPVLKFEAYANALEPLAHKCFAVAGHEFLDKCLKKYTDDNPDARRKEMDGCFNKQARPYGLDKAHNLTC